MHVDADRIYFLFAPLEQRCKKAIRCLTPWLEL